MNSFKACSGFLTSAGFHHADDEKQHQQGKTDGLQRSVYIYDDVPDAAAFKFRGGLDHKLPDFRQLVIPGFQSIVQIINYPVAASQINSPHFQDKARV
jgi:hypothetical protein